MDELVPIFGMLTGIVMMTVLGMTIVKVMNGPVGKALARRLGHGAEGEEPSPETEALLERIESVEHRLLETEERLEFTERLLSDPARRGDGT